MTKKQEPSQDALPTRTSHPSLGELSASANGNGKHAGNGLEWTAFEANHSADQSILLTQQQRVERFSPELLSIISHELRSPLAAIKGYAATLRKHEQRLSRTERREFLDAIDEASNRLNIIVEHILELSQLELGLVALNRGPLALSRLVREALAEAERRLAATHEAKQVYTFLFTDHTKSKSESGTLVYADARYIRDVVDNLIENAIKYSPHGGIIAMSLSPARLTSDGGRPALELTVRDTGIGIADGHLAHIIEAFHRVDIQSTRATGGLGLGLAICREIVERHDGELRAESTPGHGSALHVVLPLAEDPEDIQD